MKKMALIIAVLMVVAVAIASPATATTCTGEDCIEYPYNPSGSYTDLYGFAYEGYWILVVSNQNNTLFPSMTVSAGWVRLATPPYYSTVIKVTVRNYGNLDPWFFLNVPGFAMELVNYINWLVANSPGYLDIGESTCVTSWQISSDLRSYEKLP